MPDVSDIDADAALARTVAGGLDASDGPTSIVGAGTEIGRFVVTEQIGSGGMGVVFAARDPDLNRAVAIKLLRPGASAGSSPRSARARQLREAQAMARLSHPNAVTVYEVGTFGDGVFIAMELIDGSNLTGWLKDRPRTVDEILSVFEHAGRGLEAAHSAGLVHRDFKPDNVLVGRDGRVLVTDFGLVDVNGEARAEGAGNAEAKSVSALAATVTQTQGIAGTPAYMSPEQHAGKTVDSRTDQYSFCVALYEALYGHRPFEASTYDALVEAVSTGRVTTPQKSTRVPARVRAAILRGLRTAPDQRFATMAELLAPLVSRPRLTARRGIAAGAVGAIGLATVAFALMARGPTDEPGARCAASAAKLAGVWDEPARARVSRAFLATHRAHASSTLTRVTATLDDYADEWLAMHAEACRATEVRHDQPEEVMHLRMACLARRRTELRTLVELFSNADQDVVDHAVTTGRDLVSLDRCADVSTLASAHALPTDPAVREAVDALRARIARSDMLLKSGRHADALAVIEEARPQWDAIDYSPVRGAALYTLGLAQQYNGDASAAEATLRDATRLATEVGDDELAAKAWMHLAWVVGHMQTRPQEGLAFIDIAIAALERAGNDPAILAELHVIASAVANNANQPEVVRRHLRAAVSLEAKLGDHMSVASARNNLAVLLVEEGELESAAAQFEEVRQVMTQLLGAEHPAVVLPMLNEGDAYVRMGEYERALPLCRRALTLLESTVGPDHPDNQYALSCEGRALLGTGDVEHAIETLERYLVLDPANPNAPWERSEVEFALARALVEGRLERGRALGLAKSARAGFEKGGAKKATQLAELDAWLESNGSQVSTPR